VPGSKGEVTAASNGTDFLVVWRDGRGGRSGIEALLATRVTALGEVLDPLGIPIDVEEDRVVHSVRVVWANQSWIVIWRMYSSEPMSGVMAARLSPDGEILTPGHIVSKQGWVAETTPYAAVLGSRIVIGYSAEGGKVGVVVLDGDSNVVADHRLTHDTGRNHQFVSVAASATQFVVVWQTNVSSFFTNDGTTASLDAVRLTADGAPIDAEPRSIGSGTVPVIGSDGGDFVVVSRTTYKTGTVVAQTVSRDLDVSAPVILPQQPSLNLRLSVAWTGASYVVVAQHDTDRIYAVFLETAGGLRASQPLILPKTAGRTPVPFVVNNQSDILIIWLEWTDQTAAVRAQLFDDRTLAPRGDELLLTRSAVEHRDPVIAFGGRGYLAVWREGSGIWATRVALDGVSLDGRGVQLSSDTWISLPCVVFDGEHYIAAWSEVLNKRVAVSFIDPQTGAIVGRAHIPTSPELPSIAVLSDVALAAGSDATLLVWSEQHQTASYRTLGARIDRKTLVVSSPIALSAWDKGGTPAVAWNGAYFLVAWALYGWNPADNTYPTRIDGARVSQNLVVQQPSVLADRSTGYDTPLLASNGRDWMLVWYTQSGMSARRIDSNGLPAAGSPAVVVAPTWLRGAITWTGSRYAFAWRDAPGAQKHQIWTTWLSVDATVSTPILVSESGSLQSTVAVTPVTGGVAIVYTRRTWEAPYAGVDHTFMAEVTYSHRTRAVR